MASAALLWGTGQAGAQTAPPPPLASNVNYTLPNPKGCIAAERAF
jgi:hypothetical protein